MSDLGVKIFMLVTGEKVIGEVVDFGNVIKIKHPYVLKEVVEQTSLSVIPFPFMHSEQEIIIINFNNVITYPCEPKKELSDAYKKLTSNLIIPQSNIII